MGCPQDPENPRWCEASGGFAVLTGAAHHGLGAEWTGEGCWRYQPSRASGLIEIGTLHGHRVALPLHFHAENQITFVVSGCRHFVIRGRDTKIPAGQGIMIPAGMPHCSLPTPEGVACVNAYVPAGEYAVAPLMREVAELWRSTGHLHEADLAGIVLRHLERPWPGIRAAADPVKPSVTLTAAREGQTREGFTRAFSRRHGMPPHAYWAIQRLNLARARLRNGEPLAGVAADMGFADQSHFGGAFRKVFGTTPGKFRAAMLARSQIS